MPEHPNLESVEVRQCIRGIVEAARATNVLQRSIPSTAIWLATTLVLTMLGAMLQSGVHLNHDVAWMTHSARWLLEGKEFGREVLDTNLPTAWLPSFPAAVLVGFGMTEASGVRLTMWMYFLVCAYLLFAVLARSQHKEFAGANGWKLGFLVAATLLPGFSFGQREHVAVIFAMPYLALATVRLQGVEAPRRWVCVGVGLLAGVGFAIKPYFLAVPLLVEAGLFLRLGWSTLRRDEGMALAVTFAGCAVFMVVQAPEYLGQTVPLVRAFYWAYDAPSYYTVLSRYQAVAQPTLAGLGIALLTRTWTTHHSVVLLATIGFSASYLVQAKGFVYHAYPVLVCACALLAISVAAGAVRIRREWRQSRMRGTLIMALVVCLTVYPLKKVHDSTATWYFQHNIEWGRTGTLRQAVIDIVAQYAPHESDHFYAFSTHPFPGFPTASYTDADWSGRAPMQFMVPAYARRDEVHAADLKKKVLATAGLQRKIVVADMTERPPAVVFVERSPARLGLYGQHFDDIAFYMQDQRFSKIWSQYVEIAPIGPLRVFVRREAK